MCRSLLYESHPYVASDRARTRYNVLQRSRTQPGSWSATERPRLLLYEPYLSWGEMSGNQDTRSLHLLEADVNATDAPATQLYMTNHLGQRVWRSLHIMACKVFNNDCDTEICSEPKQNV